MKTFADLFTDTTPMASASVTGTTPPVVDIYVNAPAADAEGNVADAWALVEAGVACTFLDQPTPQVRSFEEFGRVVDRVLRWVSFPTRHDLTPRHRLVLIDGAGNHRAFAVVGSYEPGLGGAEWRVACYEVQ